jgi:hypothetical protein
MLMGIHGRLIGLFMGIFMGFSMPQAKSTVIQPSFGMIYHRHIHGKSNHGTPEKTIDTQCFAGIHDIVSLLQEMDCFFFQLMLGDIEAMYLYI